MHIAKHMDYGKKGENAMKIRFAKKLFCAVLAVVLLFSVCGCGNKYPKFKDGKYVDSKGQTIEQENVTLDVIAQSEYKKNFDELEQADNRKNVISIYLKYHLPAASDSEIACKEVLIEQISSLDVSNSDMVNLLKNGVSSADNSLMYASNAYALADIYSKIKDDKGFEEFVGKLSKTCEIASVVTNFTKACFIVADLANNDMSNKQEYCGDIIDALSYITSYVPFFDVYFEKTLDTVKIGMYTIIEQYDKRYGILPALDADLDNKLGFFSNNNFEIILHSKDWESEIAPSIADIIQKSYQFDTIPQGEPFNCLKNYILFRVSYENLHPEYNENYKLNAPNYPIIEQSTTWHGIGSINYVGKYNFKMVVYQVNENYISGFLQVYSIDYENDNSIKIIHETNFKGNSVSTVIGGTNYLLKFDQSVTFGSVQPFLYTYEEMTVYYIGEEDTFTFDLMYHVTMTRA